MRTLILHHWLLISALLDIGQPLLRSGLVSKWSQFSHKVITTNVIAVAEDVGSGLQCASLCLENQACVSVFYRQVLRVCQFHDVLFLSPQDGEEENGTMYYSLTTGLCPLGYVHYRLLGICYKPHFDAMIYYDCVADCASRGEHLIVIDSQEKQDHVKKQIISSSDSATRSFFIDGSDAETEGSWVYHDGRPMTFFAWATGFPDNSVGRDYLVVSMANGEFLWHDKKKIKTKFYICEKDLLEGNEVSNNTE